MVAVLDRRLGTATYRWDIVRALPPMRRTRDRAEVEAFLADLDRLDRETPGSAVECRGGRHAAVGHHEPSHPHRHARRVPARAGAALGAVDEPAAPSRSAQVVARRRCRDRRRRRWRARLPAPCGPPGSTPATAPVTDASGGPKVMVPAAIAPSVPGFVSTLRGLTDGAATLTANGAPVAIEPGGSFTMYIPQGTTEVRLVATGADGATGESVVAVTDAVPAPTYPATSALHVRAEDWANPADPPARPRHREPGRINAVQLDIKDEAGEVGYASAGPAGDDRSVRPIGTTTPAQAIDELHASGSGSSAASCASSTRRSPSGRGRTAAPTWSCSTRPGSAPLANNYGTAAFTNPASAEVRQYQIDLATEAVGLGFDEILYDYVRRPEGDIGDDAVPRPRRPPRRRRRPLRRRHQRRARGTDATLGVSVFGISATRPEPTAQDIRLLAPHVDYVSPMVYPSHWGSGEYDVADPVRQPADIVEALGRRLRAHRRRQRRGGRAVAAGLLVGRRDLRTRRGARADRRRPRGRLARGSSCGTPTRGTTPTPSPTARDDATASSTSPSPTAWRRSRSTRPPTATPCRRRSSPTCHAALDVAERRRRCGPSCSPTRRRRSAPAPTSRSAAAGPPDSRPFVAVLRRLMDADVPTIAAVKGPARAGGIGLMAACDLVVVRRDVTFALTEVRIGVAAAIISVPILRRVERPAAGGGVPHRRVVRRRAARHVGLVTHVTDDVDGDRRRLCDGIRRRTAAVAATKRLLRRGAGLDRDDGVRPHAGPVRRAVRRPRRRRGHGRLRREAPPAWRT